jgi:hypothetical protein
LVAFGQKARGRSAAAAGGRRAPSISPILACQGAPEARKIPCKLNFSTGWNQAAL